MVMSFIILAHKMMNFLRTDYIHLWTVVCFSSSATLELPTSHDILLCYVKFCIWLEDVMSMYFDCKCHMSRECRFSVSVSGIATWKLHQWDTHSSNDLNTYQHIQLIFQAYWHYSVKAAYLLSVINLWCTHNCMHVCIYVQTYTYTQWMRPCPLQKTSAHNRSCHIAAIDATNTISPHFLCVSETH